MLHDLIKAPVARLAGAVSAPVDLGHGLSVEVHRVIPQNDAPPGTIVCPLPALLIRSRPNGAAEGPLVMMARIFEAAKAGDGRLYAWRKGMNIVFTPHGDLRKIVHALGYTVPPTSLRAFQNLENVYRVYLSGQWKPDLHGPGYPEPKAPKKVRARRVPQAAVAQVA